MSGVLKYQGGFKLSRLCTKSGTCGYSPIKTCWSQLSPAAIHNSVGLKHFWKPLVLKTSPYSTLAPKAKPSEDKSVHRLSSICFRPDSQTPAPVTKEDRPSLNAADKFFRQRYAFLYSASELKNHPINLIIPEIVILGRSNVGKSTFINALLGRSDAAKVSKKAGHTSTMNVFGIGSPEFINKDFLEKGMRPPRHGLRLLDTPGYGFRSHMDWGDTIIKYLNKRKSLRGAVLLYNRPGDAHDADRNVLKALAEANCKTLIVLTKADTLGPSWAEKLSQSVESIRPELRKLSATQENGWKEGTGWIPDVYAISAGMRSSPKGLGTGGGIPGVRRAIMDMAGYNLQDKIEVKPENIAYDGDVVSFDDIKWKS